DTLGRRNQRMLFVIDELEWLFQNFSVPSASDNYHPVVAATLRSVIQDMRRIAFVLAGVSDVLSQHTRGPAQRLFRMAVEVKLWPLAEPFAAAALESPVRHVLRYTAPALELILRLTGRHPYLLQRVGHLLYEHCGKKSQRVISREDVEWVIDRQLARDRSIFGFLLDVVPAATRPLVDHVAQLQSENRYVPLPLLAQELGRDEAVVTTALDEIREQLGSVFELRQRGVRINVPLFARHLRYLARGSFSLVRPRR
ncbi:MAG TPA: hypothetical protein PKW90_07375, partial [Myxococcota bacterium]|nr:hypothetical protein [Myxococcota bacterium]